MEINYLKPYRKRTSGEAGHIYTVSGTPEELAEFKKLKGEHYREDGGKPLLFAGKVYDNGTKLVKNTAGTQFYVDSLGQETYAQLCKEGGIEYADKKIAGLKQN